MKRVQIILIIVVSLLLCGCNKRNYEPCVNQPIENVSSIELLDTNNNEETVLYTLSESEYVSFWSQFMTIPFSKYFNDPPTEYGILAVKITYSNGYVDIIGTDINLYYDDTGKGMRTGWFCAVDEDDFVSLFAQYVNETISASEE